MACAQCSEEITSKNDSIECYGFCGHKFYFQCVANNNTSYKKSILSFLINIPNLQWYCNDCIPHTISGTFNGILKKLDQCSDDINQLAKSKLKPQTDSFNVDVSQNNSLIISTQMPTLTHTTNGDNASTVPFAEETNTLTTSSQHNDSSQCIEMRSADEDENIESVITTQSNNKRKLIVSVRASDLKRQKSINSSMTSDATASQLGDFVLSNATVTTKATDDVIQNKPATKHIYVTPLMLKNQILLTI